MSALFIAMPLISRGADIGAAEKNSVVAADHGGAAPQAEAEHGLPSKAVKLTGENGFITNSMLVTWIVALGLIAFAQLATKNIQQVPSGLQNFWEFLVEGLYGFLESIVGTISVRRFRGRPSTSTRPFVSC